MLKKFHRRHFLLKIFSTTVFSLESTSFAATTRRLFDANSPADASKLYAEKDPIEPSNQLLVDTPEISAEPGRISIRIRSELPGTDMMLIISPSIVPPVIAQFLIPVGTEADITTMIKLSGTSKIQLVVRAGGRLYSAQKEVKIAIPLNTKLLME
ncbi:thiosulfate oxidation carrier protein SoxY [Undibacterium sp. RTI2.1]|uniref:thiosulfate oxidation carrier protein SoxY n=1 Tax=unclassified Undibacterium TaxID=2630295 RepID=UPI002AB3EC1A|nr:MULTISPECIES: thiosulfate oxidation carrier protein SoxY [unclassified Undibacterium]MDY7539945.1 thiosulfate oxidation carrier protein SoxY [Undibacterium sp. 5I1]MEB0032802.1 thiosulfate oxidation carrier protein SoxY [Undibacterium sp. RTI2.1]MEB0116456.1 thiosulfate oxidation carrier protein SoxY [Undibacterium sp. RTI2.2]MEB0230552.1 thiosulfate oxidation carrier protein SoxY [Undibacterium sp. 10I3]MEB0257250.1 thiosulfate oxidation carrier protein SoxY [Undibacterium sp. 5I1]